METNFFEQRVRSLERPKWYIQPLDSMSAGVIYKRTKEALELHLKTGFMLKQVDRKTIEKLMRETSLAALYADEKNETDFGVNFAVFIQRYGEGLRFCFFTNRQKRKENAKRIQKEWSIENRGLKLVANNPRGVPEKEEKEVTFVLHTDPKITEQETKTEKPAPEKVVFERFKRSSLYRISTHQLKIIDFLKDELSKLGEPTDPIPGIYEGPEGKESVWAVPPSVALALKAHTRCTKSLFFKIWKRTDEGKYLLVEEYPLFEKQSA